MMKFVCVFCGAKEGVDGKYLEVARELGREFVRRNLGLVFGGSYSGLMRAIAETVKQQGGQVIGIGLEAYKHFLEPESFYNELYIAKSISERKQLMYEKSDAFISMPGGMGTLDEYFWVHVKNSIMQDPKPSALLNVDGYYDSLIDQISNGSKQGFIEQERMDMFVTDSNVSNLLDTLLSIS